MPEAFRFLGRNPGAVLASGLVALALVSGILGAREARATDEPEESLVNDHLEARHSILQSQLRNANALTSKHGLVAYRLARLRDLRFFSQAHKRREDARAADLALVIFRRSLDEKNKIAHELSLVQDERSTLKERDDKVQGNETLLQALREAPTDEVDVDRVATTKTVDYGFSIVFPVSGAVVGRMGVHTDRETRAKTRLTGVQILARMDADAKAPAPGKVFDVHALAEGGFAVVIYHGAGYTSIVSGLRQVRVNPGQSVETGDSLGLVGRTLDSAPVLRLAVWRNGEALNPLRLRTR